MEIGLNKIMIFPEKLQAIVAAQSGKIDNSYPISVELSLTNECNQHCIWCSDYELRNRLPGSLTLASLQRLFGDLKAGGTTGITIEGGGEPTLHPDFNAIVTAARDAGLAVGLITNGVELVYEELLGEFEWIRVSLDASDAEEYRRLKGEDHFEQVMTNIATIAAGCSVCGVGYIVTQHNIDFLDALTVRLKRMGVQYIHFRPVIDHPELFIDKDLSYLRKYENQDFGIIADGLTENKIRGNAELPCRAHSLTSIVSANGDVFICGRLNIYDWLKPIGNINKQGFSEIWSGVIRKEQAKQVSDSNFCNRFCPECRLTKYNMLFNELTNIKTRSFI